MNQPGAVDLVRLRGDVRYDHVGFAYSDGTQVLNDFDLHIAPGETVALVGPHRFGQDDRWPVAQPFL